MRSANIRSPMAWACPVCGGAQATQRFAVPAGGTEAGVDADAFRPSSERFGTTTGRVVRCVSCGHAALAEAPAATAMATAYAGAADPVSLREEPGQVETARRALVEVERVMRPGRVADLGCWTGSFLVAARERGWKSVGVEPSTWASDRARERGLDVRTTDIAAHGLEPGTFRLVVLCDVLEHLTDPGAALEVARDLLEPGGVLYVTVPDAGSLLARLLGRRWWSVLPMHVQYFTRDSLRLLLESHGFTVQSMRSHAKAFSARYYAERVGGYSQGLERVAVGVLERLHFADRLVVPDLRDRIGAISTSPPR